MQLQLAASVLALAATAAATYGNASAVSYTTEIVTDYTTYCAEPTQLSYNGQTYTITEATTLTITNCPCTVSKPVYTTSSVVCQTCPAVTSAPTYANTSSAGATVTYPVTPVYPVGTGSATASGTPTPSTITTNGGSKAMAVSGAGLAGLLGLAAFIL